MNPALKNRNAHPETLAGHIAELTTDASIDSLLAVNKNYEIILWNRKSEEITGLNKDAVLGRPFFDVFPAARNSTDIVRAFEVAFSGMNYFLPAGKGYYAQGYYENHFAPLKKNDEIIGVLNIGHDVAHRVKAENQLKALNKSLAVRNRQLEQRNAELSSISYITSHDLKEPLRKIFTFIDLLKNEETAQFSESSKLYFKRIQLAAQRLSLLTDDIQLYSQLSLNGATLEDVDLNDVLDTALQTMKLMIRTKKAMLQLEHLPVVFGERQLLVQLFQVVLSNALKFHREGNIPHITIKGRTVSGNDIRHPDVLPDTSYAEIVFMDNGIGFEREYNDKIFRIFQRLHGNNEYAGTGIGLAIAKKIIELHHGFIIVESRKDAGSSFRCFFPTGDTGK
jgi:signal transduction histidine kinase